MYGTLRRAFEIAPVAVIARGAAFAGMASYRGRLYDLVPYPAAVPSTDPDETVIGEVYRLHAERAEELLAHLDAYEDCPPDAESGELFVRKPATVTLDSGETLSAWIYLYNRPVDGLPRIPCGDYVAFKGLGK